jgi:histidinol dehydrogenase
VQAAAVLITTDRTMATDVQLEIANRLAQHSHPLLIEKALAHSGLIVVVDKIAQAIELTNSFAPAQLLLWVTDPWEISGQFQRVGTIFLGEHTPPTSYLLGPSTINSLASGLGVETFMRYSNLVEYSPSALHQLETAIGALAQAEGLMLAKDTLTKRSQ